MDMKKLHNIIALIVIYVVSSLSIYAGLSMVKAYTGGNPFSMWYGPDGLKLDGKNIIVVVIIAANIPVYKYLSKRVGGGFAGIVVLTAVCLESFVFGMSCGIQLLR